MRLSKITYWPVQVVGWSLFACINIILQLIQNVFTSSSFSFLIFFSEMGLLGSHCIKLLESKQDYSKWTLKRFIKSILLLLLFSCMAALITLLYNSVVEKNTSFYVVFTYSLSYLSLFFFWSFFYNSYKKIIQIKAPGKTSGYSLQTENKLKENVSSLIDSLEDIEILIEKDQNGARTSVTKLSLWIRDNFYN